MFNIKTTQPTVLAALLWEAALCFSFPTWYAANHAWPANDPYRFALAVTAGATVSLLLCHIVPALFAQQNQRGPLRILAWIVWAWLAIGAAASAIWLARSMARWSWRSYQGATLRTELTAVAALVLAVVITHAAVRWQMTIAATLGLIGVVVILASAVSQARGLWIATGQVPSEDALANDLDVFKGILIASAPASIFAYRAGRARLTRRAIVWTGLWAIWLPIVLSVTLVALAMMGGARLYWRPSASVDAIFAFVWLAKTIGINFVYLMSVLSLMAMLAPVFWISEIAPRRASLALRIIAPTIVGIIGLWMTLTDGAVVFGYHLPLFVDESSFQIYYQPWCWSILIASAAYGSWMVLRGSIRKAKERFTGSRP